MWIIEMSFEFLGTSYECQTPQRMVEPKNQNFQEAIKNFETGCMRSAYNSKH
jgi:hypothetical protein